MRQQIPALILSVSKDAGMIGCYEGRGNSKSIPLPKTSPILLAIPFSRQGGPDRPDESGWTGGALTTG